MRDILTDLGDMMSDPDPVRRAQIQMKKPLPKRFYSAVSVVELPEGHAIHLDGKPLKTPARNTLAVPSQTLAESLAAEWDSQTEVIDPGKMPLTRLVNTALDGVAGQMEAVAEEIVRYAGTDLLCYRADGPEELVARQTRLWDPVLDWIGKTHGVRLILAEGIIHQDQPANAIMAFARLVSIHRDPVRLASLHVMTTLTGSAVLALAFAEGELSAEEVWRLAHLDEDWNIELWGSDLEAEHRRKHRHVDFEAAATAFKSIG